MEKHTERKMFKLKMVCGEKAVRRMYNGIPLDEEDTVREFNFATEAEKKAFIEGAQTAIGWLEIYFPDEEEWSEGKGSARIEWTKEI